jgi:hypothetical protein
MWKDEFGMSGEIDIPYEVLLIITFPQLTVFSREYPGGDSNMQAEPRQSSSGALSRFICKLLLSQKSTTSSFPSSPQRYSTTL